MCFETRSQLFQTKQKVMWLERMSLLQTKNRGISQSVFVAKASQSSPSGDTQQGHFAVCARRRGLPVPCKDTSRVVHKSRAENAREKTRIIDPTTKLPYFYLAQTCFCCARCAPSFLVRTPKPTMPDSVVLLSYWCRGGLQLVIGM